MADGSAGTIISSGSSPSGWHAPVFVGDIRLTDFKRVLQTAGITAEFRGEGVLVCNDQVAVRKVGLLIVSSLARSFYMCDILWFYLS